MGKVLLFYKYVHIEYPKRIFKWQQKICTDFGLTGRILLGHEGINGTLGGTDEDTERYIKVMHENPLFSNIDFKISVGDSSCFPRLQIKIRSEIVRLGIDPNLINAKDGGIHLKPDQVHTLLSNRPKNLVVFDARNSCEWQIGAFEDAIKPDINYFRQLPTYIDEHLEQFKDKDVLMYCTGGIRCERASAYLKSKNVTTKVYQIEGGIHNYIERYPNGFFKGKNYVFDGRVATKANDVILGHCNNCSNACDDYTNCLNASCNKHFVCCQDCLQKLDNTCSKACLTLVTEKTVTIRPDLKKVEFI
jgi:predicted sulfurtransferase